MASYAVDGFSRGSPEKIEHLLRESKKYKEEGNHHYQSGEYKSAIRCYHKSLLYIRSINQGQGGVGALLGLPQQSSEALPKDYQLRISKLTLDCHNNLAVCLMKRDKPDYGKVITYCDLVIAEQESNYKAHFRKAQALYKLEDFHAALESFLAAKKHMGTLTDAQLMKHIEMCHKAIKRDDNNLTHMYKRMFQQEAATP